VSELRPQILHVDDEGEVLEQVADYVGRVEIPGWGAPEITSIENFDDALNTLERQRFDLLILDVRLGGHENDDAAPDEEEGIRTLAAIKARRFLPIIFWTGLPRKVEDLTGALVRAVSKDSGLKALSESAMDLFAAGLPGVNRGLRHLVEEEQRAYMWDFVAEHWEDLRQHDDHAGLAYLLVRRLGRSFSDTGIATLAERLAAPDAPPSMPPPGTMHASEMYIVPPIPGSDRAVSELLQDADGNWLFTLTPSCDLAHSSKLDYVILAECAPAEEDGRVIAWLKDPGSKGATSRLKDLIEGKTGGQEDRWIFLPAAPTIPPLVVDLQRLRSMPLAEFSQLTRIASLASPFAEAAVNRFGRYLGRIGTDDLDSKPVMNRFVLEQERTATDQADPSGSSP
jgi:CheY-like chemotaxis protein